MVDVPCARPVSPSVQLPLVSAVVVALVALLEIIEDASAVPVNVSVVDVETAPSDDGAVIIGGSGGVVSVVVTVDDEVDDDDGEGDD